MNKQKGFTVVELFAVVLILGIMIAMGVRKFGNIGTERYHAERCISQIYREISNFYSEAAGGKISANEGETPDAYIISTIDDENNKGRIFANRLITGLELSYQYKDEITSIKKIFFGDISGCEKHSNGKYIVLGKTTIRTGTLMPNLQSRGVHSAFELKTKKNSSEQEQIFTGDIHFSLCEDVHNTNCQDFSKILFDARAGLIKRSICKEYKADDKKKCKERSTELE
ncbi:type II secretion system protein [Candidatus Gracilibacteria bacterium]|nr:type II secretion system protein [Candidatus Gracilibacteria bacterium]